jgi:putative membrane protein
MSKMDASTYFAAERTMLAWIRTGLALMGFGFVVARFGLFLRELQAVAQLGRAQSYSVSLWAGTGLVLLGVVVNVVSTIRYRSTIARLNRGEGISTEPSALATATSLMLAMLGLFIAIYLLHR